MGAAMDTSRKLRELLATKDYIVTFGIHNPMQAMIAEKTGYDVVYMGGHDTTAMMLGLPDIGLITETEMVGNARNIARAVNVPVLADADTGYGNAINVIRTVQNYEAAGVAGIHIEDQVMPKRCGQAAGKTVIPLDEAAGKIRAAVDAKKNPDFVIIARTDAVTAAGGSLEEGIRRGKAYARAGADMLFCDFPSEDLQYARRFAAEIHQDFAGLPLFFNYCTRFKWQQAPATFSDIAALGYKLMNISTAAMRVSMQAVWDYAVDVRQRGERAEMDFAAKLKAHPTEDFHSFTGLSNIRELEAKYLPADEMSRKYGD